MSSDDPRHGTNAGYVAGCRGACCLRAKSRYDKARKWELHSTGQHRKVPAYRALRRLRALQALGWSIPQIARRADVNERHLYSLSRHGTLYRSTFVKIVRAYDGMCMSLPPTTTTSERISAVKARKWALRNGYAPPLAWDDIDTDAGPLGQRCAVADCPKVASRRGWCDAHYRRWKRNGDPVTPARMGRPRGEDASYNAVHFRLKRERGRACDRECVDCGQAARTWSYNHTDPECWIDAKGRPYTTDLAHYSPRCTPCHNEFDRVAKVDRTIDEAVVLRILDGDNRVHANAAERVEVCRRWVAGGRSLSELERLTGWRTSRYYKIEEVA